MPIGCSAVEVVGRLVERVGRGQATLVHRGRRQRREADDVTDGVDVRHRGLVLLVDDQPAPLVGLEPGPARGRARPVLPCRPAECMTTSAAIRLPEARVVMVPPPELSTEATSSPKRNDMVWSRRWNLSDSTISGSQKSSIWSRFSTSVTRVPSAANIEAYSTPITPAPDDDHGAGDLVDGEDLVGVEHPHAVELDVRGPRRDGPGGDDDVSRGQRAVHRASPRGPRSACAGRGTTPSRARARRGCAAAGRG